MYIEQRGEVRWLRDQIVMICYHLITRNNMLLGMDSIGTFIFSLAMFDIFKILLLITWYSKYSTMYNNNVQMNSSDRKLETHWVVKEQHEYSSYGRRV